MRIKEYMREMYIRIMYILFSVIITSICAYASAGKLIYILAAPLEEAQKARKEREKMTGEWKEEPFGEEFHFIFTEITEAFMAATKLSMFIGMYMQWPIILYQLWLYIKPGLYQYESKGALATMIIAWGLSGINIIMTYWIILPATCKFFLSFEMSGAEAIQYGIKIHLEAKIYTYLYLVEKTIFWGHCLLQLPTLAILCIRWWPKGTEKLIKRPRIARGIYYIVAIIISGIIATPDIISQMVVAIPIILLYEVTMYIVCIFSRTAQGKEKDR